MGYPNLRLHLNTCPPCLRIWQRIVPELHFSLCLNMLRYLFVYLPIYLAV